MKQATRIGFWNVRTLREAGKIRQLEKEMENYKVDILGVTEVRWNDFGETRTNGGKTFLHSGQVGEDAESRNGVGMLMTKSVQKSMLKWDPISDRLMWVKFKGKVRNITVFVCYAPTELATQDIKDEFYSSLTRELNKASKRDIKIIIGDLNAKVGNENDGLEHVMGKHGLGERNENGEMFVNLCAEHDLVIGGTLFPHPDCHKVTWVSPDHVTQNQIDHIAISRKFRSSLLDVRNKRGADIWSDHHLILATLRIKVLVNKKKQLCASRKLDIGKLRAPIIREQYCIELRNRYQKLADDGALNAGVENTWKNIRDAIRETGENILGYRNKQKKEWMSEETWEKVSRRKNLKQKYDNSRTRAQKQIAFQEYSEANRNVKRYVRRDKRRWVDELAQEAEEAARQGNSKKLYDITRKLSRTNFSREKPVKDKNGNMLTNENDKLNRWMEHFSELLGKVDLHQEELALPPPVLADQDINLESPTLEEVKDALRSMRNGKAPGLDNIQAELIKAGDAAANLLHPLIQQVWHEERVPNEWKKGIIVKIPKKGDATLCSNWRGITLLSVPSKVLARIILNRIQQSIEKKLRKEQAGFRSARSCVDLINTLRILLEQSKEFQTTLYLTFVDFEKAFDTVKHQVLWHVLQEYGIPGKIISIIKDMYDGYECHVLHQGKLTEAIPVNAGVRQGCILSPILFLLVLDSVMRRVTRNRRRGIQWGLRERLEDLDFADDICLLAQRYTDIQAKLHSLQEEAELVGLKININKTKEMRLNARTAEALELHGKVVEEVTLFQYLGSIVTAGGGAKEDVRSRIKKANVAFIQLYPIWRNRNLSLRTKIRIFNTNVKSVLLYASETWKMDRDSTSKLQVFVNRCLRRILRVFWPNTISNEQLWERTGQQKIDLEIRRRKWRWLGHTLRKPDTAIEKKALEWNPQGTRKRGRPCGTWKRTMEKEAGIVGRTWGQLRDLARDRNGWRALLDALCS